jgi:AcrR family transcriptional regulator
LAQIFDIEGTLNVGRAGLQGWFAKAAAEDTLRSVQVPTAGGNEEGARLQTRRAGRPRRFDADVERRLVMDAALRVMARNQFADAPVDDVLAEAGVSTRAFYRHFRTKDDLLLALFRRDAEAVAQKLRIATERAASAADGLDAWIDAFLDVFYEARRAARVKLFTSAAVQTADGYMLEYDRSRAANSASLTAVLQRGSADGSLHSADPEQDARTIEAIAASVLAPSQGRRYASREQAKAHIERFCIPALTR